VSLVAALSLVTACVESSEEDAQTPPGAATVANSAVQTNSKGETVTAPAIATRAETPADTSGGGTEVKGDAAAGEALFATTCGGCHTNGGQEAGVGPKLAGAGLDAATVTDVLENGRPGTAMVGGLVSGEDLDNVVAYVVSLQ